MRMSWFVHKVQRVSMVGQIQASNMVDHTGIILVSIETKLACAFVISLEIPRSVIQWHMSMKVIMASDGGLPRSLPANT